MRHRLIPTKNDMSTNNDVYININDVCSKRRKTHMEQMTEEIEYTDNVLVLFLLNSKKTFGIK